MRAPMVWTRWQHRWGGAALLVLFAGTVAFAGSEQRLVEAAKARDLTAVRWLLDEKVDVDGAQPDGATALHWAAYWNELDMVEVLLDAGAQASAVNELGATPLWLASFNCNPALVPLIFDFFKKSLVIWGHRGLERCAVRTASPSRGSRRLFSST